MFEVVFDSYCGMTRCLARGLDRVEVKETIRRIIRSARRQGRFVDKIRKGVWEVQTPDDACMISDEEGILSVRRVRG